MQRRAIGHHSDRCCFPHARDRSSVGFSPCVTLRGNCASRPAHRRPGHVDPFLTCGAAWDVTHLQEFKGAGASAPQQRLTIWNQRLSVSSLVVLRFHLAGSARQRLAAEGGPSFRLVGRLVPLPPPLSRGAFCKKRPVTESPAGPVYAGGGPVGVSVLQGGRRLRPASRRSCSSTSAPKVGHFGAVVSPSGVKRRGSPVACDPIAKPGAHLAAVDLDRRKVAAFCYPGKRSRLRIKRVKAAE